MTLYAIKYKIFERKRSDACTFFASMDEGALTKMMGDNVKQIGQWHNPGRGNGMMIAESSDVNDLYKFIWAWSEEMSDIECVPVLDDNKAREAVLKEPAAWTKTYDNIDAEPEAGETLYMISWVFDNGEARVKGYEIFANLTKEQDEGDYGNCRFLGRWHIPAEGKGYIVCTAKDQMDVHKWVWNWAGLCTCHVEPVLTNKAATEVVKAKAGYDKKLSALMQKLTM